MTLWREHAKPDELERYAALERDQQANNHERQTIRRRCLTRARRLRAEPHPTGEKRGSA